jgi:hypothetical protein
VYIVFFSLLILTVLTFVWMLRPLLIKTKLRDIRYGEYFGNYNILKFLCISILFSWAVASVDIDQGSGLSFYLFILKIIYISEMEIVFFIMNFSGSIPR